MALGDINLARANIELAENRCSVGYHVDTRDPSNSWVMLEYTLGTGEKLEYRKSAHHHPPDFGGLGWWFACGLIVNGRECGARVKKLYLPPGGRYFGCRRCHDLTYESAQTHGTRVEAYLRTLHPAFR